MVLACRGRRERRRVYRPNQIQRVLDPIREARGNRCQAEVGRGAARQRCPTRLSFNKRGVPNLEFAHIGPTPLVGRGRGGVKRAYDIRRHPEAYLLVCRACHVRMDRLDQRDALGRWRRGPAEQVELAEAEAAAEATPEWVTEGGDDGGPDEDAGAEG